MALTAKTVEFSFLASGPRFSMLVPANILETPVLSSPLVNGIGGRSFDYAPQSLDPGIEEETQLVRTLQDGDGRTVQLLWRIEPPPMWWLRWTLRNGALYSHLREEDGEEMADITVASVAIVEDPTTGVPFLIPKEPLQFVNSTGPSFQERAVFVSSQPDDGWSVVLQRPSFVPQGSVLTAPARVTGGLPVIRAGLNYGVEVQAWAGRDLGACKEMVTTLAGSFSEI